MPLTMAQTVAYALQAGFDASAAAVYGAIAAAESGLNPTAQGDVSLMNATWGPSVGEPQIRTLRADTGKGTDRDIKRLLGDPLAQAQAALNISDQGRDWTPWTTYTTGAYQRYLTQARSAVAQVSAHPGTYLSGATGGVESVSAGGDGGLTGTIRGIVLTGLVVLLGVGLFGAGLLKTAQAGRGGRGNAR